MSIQAQVLQKRMIMTCSPPSNNISQQQHLFHLIQAELQSNQSKQQLYQTNNQLTQTKTVKGLSQQSPKLTNLSKSLLIDNEPKKTKPIKPPNRNNSCVQLIRQGHVSPSHLLEKMKRIEKPTKPSQRNPYEEIKKQIDTSLLLQSARQNIQDSYQQSTVHTQPQNTSQNVQDLLFDYQRKHEKVTNIQFKQQMLKDQQEISNKQQSTVSIFDQLIQQQLTYLKMDQYQNIEQSLNDQHQQEKQDNNVKTQKFNHNPEFDQLLHTEINQKTLTISNGALDQQQTIIQHNQQYNYSAIEEQDDYIVNKPRIIQNQTTNTHYSKEIQNHIDVNNFKDYFNDQEQVTKQQNFVPESNSHQIIDQDIEQTASMQAPPDVVVVKKVAPPVPSHEYPPQNQTQPLNNELLKQAPMQQQRSLSQTQEVEVIEAAPRVEPVQAKQAPKLPASNAPPKGNMKAIFNFSEYVFDEDPDNKVDYQMMEPKKKKPEAPKAEKEPEVQAVSAQPSEVKEEPKLVPKITPKISIPPQAKVQPKIPGKAPEQTDSKPETEKPKEDQNTKTSAPPKGNMKAIFNFSEYVFDEDPENKVDYEMLEPKKKKTEPAQVKEPEPAAQQAEVKPVEKQPTEKQKEEPAVEAKPAAKAAPLKVQLPLPPNKIQPKIPGKAPVVPKATSVPQQQEAKPQGEPKTQPPSGNMKAIFNFSEYVFDEDPENKVDYEMLEPKKKKTEKEPEAPKAEKEPQVQAVSSQPPEVKEEAKPKIAPKINIPPQVKIQPKIQQKIQIPSKDQNETKISEDKQSTLNDNKSEQEPLKQTDIQTEQKSENSQLENKSEQKTEEEPSNSEIKNSENGSKEIKPLQKQITQPMLKKIVPSSTVIKPPTKIVPPKVINQASINRPQLKIPVKPPVKAVDKQENNESQ
ncbi:histone-lysine_N-methyltransferase 2A-like isoform X2 [Hexamita inflata]|uniref:Histone-lysine N-methyltransferase 2A-like isoform X2 n=1 Tax=Hexamita inflata TaxID=28002 RepID=A0AA86TI73_9EUKA|nr:histone-lysine N-methyltransferase 2A-like isoform X2 [Hexamita inflata]